MASLFGRNTVRELAQQITTEDIQWCVDLIRKWLEDYRGGSLKGDNETSREQQYNQDIFIKILGYVDKPVVPYTFTPKDQTTMRGGQKADAVLGYFDPPGGISNVSAVVELKSADVDLDKPQQREGNLTPVQQAFKYKPMYPSCPFVVVSNFYEFRLYNNNQLDYERWTLDDLVDSEDDFIKFKSWFTLMRAESMVYASGVAPTEALLSRIRQEQEEIGKEFYAEYKDVRIELLQDIWRNNAATRDQIDTAIRKVQTIIDRIVFSCFAEDRGLLPDNIVALVLAEAERSLYGEPMFDHFKRFFRAVGEGSAQLGIPTGYNGGLFAEDPWIESLAISDDAIRQLTSLARFDFKEDLSVNILGHIFEQSITNLEEIRQKIREGKDLRDLLSEPAGTGARRSEGIYYTPDYIVRHIVDHTLGAWLREQELECQAKHGLTGRLGEKGYDKRQQSAYLEYLVILQGVRVLDPACGSGAFLVYVFDYLLKENQRVNYILGNLFETNEESVRKILSDNIFGVDINEESVEITKLSLWLKTAQKGKKLTALDENIKCGNSLISDATVTEKAFSWPTAFPKAMGEGGFDVIVGNPPYVSAIEMTKNLPAAERGHMRTTYETAVGAVDLYIYFFECGIELLRSGGKLGYITPNRWLSIGYGSALRKWLIDNVRIESILNASDTRVFEDAATYPVVTILTKGKPENTYQISAGHLEERTAVPLAVRHDSAKLNVLPENIMGFLLNDKLPLTEKVFANSESLATVGQINATSTAGEADDYASCISEDVGDIRIINTGTIDPYVTTWGLRQFRKQGRMFIKPRLNLAEVSDQRRRLYESPKIIVAKIALRAEAFYDADGAYASIDTNCIHTFDEKYLPEYVLAWVNSRLYNYVFNCLFDGARMEGGYLGFSAPNLRCTPIKPIDAEEQGKFVAPANRLSALSRECAEADDLFKKLVKTTFNLSTWPQANNAWWAVEATDFVGNFRRRFNTNQVEDLMAAHGRHSKIVGGLVTEITKLNQQIDRGFYKLFGLTRREADLVEAMPFRYL